MSKQTYTTGQVLTSAQMTQLQANDYNQTVSAKVASYTLVASDAGTRITMSNASATTITVNTSLFTAGDTLIITNIGAGVCTITAGTATVSTGGSLALAQYDSGTLYFTSTGVSIWNGVNPGDITGVTASTGLTGGGTSGTVSLAIDSTVATLTGTQTLTNKTLTTPIISSISNTGTLTLPTSTDTLVGRATTDTLTNKTLTSPALTTPTISTLTTNGDLVYGTGSGALSRLGIGSSANVLTVAGGVPTWAAPAASAQKIIQVVNATYNTSTTIAQTSYQDSGLSAAITPTLNTSTILVIITQNGRLNLTTNYNYVSSRLLRDATAITTYADNYLAASFTGPTAVYVGGLLTWTWVDSPATTSQITYKPQYKLQHTTNSNFVCQSDSTYSTMTLIEIGA